MDGTYNRPSNFDRRLEIVSGKSNQIYAAGGVRSPEFFPARVSTSSAKPWGGFSDPESKRKKRIVKYKVYTIEGRVKASFRNGIRWIKNKCSEFIHGYWLILNRFGNGKYLCFGFVFVVDELVDLLIWMFGICWFFEFWLIGYVIYVASIDLGFGIGLVMVKDCVLL